MNQLLKIFFCSIFFFSASSFAGMLPPEPEPEPELPSNNSSTGPANTVTGIGNIINHLTNTPLPSTGAPVDPNSSGDFGLDNLRINGGYTLTSFDDANVGSSGHFREYSLTLSGDLGESDTISFGVSNTRYETGSTNGILARTNGISFTWIHHLNENYGIGAFGLANEVDIEEINGNSYSYAYGALFTTYHDLDAFSLSSATAIAHSEFDTGYDQLIMSSLTATKFWTDNCANYATLTFVDSFKSDPDTDATYGSWEVGAIYIVNDNLTLSAGFSRTEFLNNYTDNTLLLNATWSF